MIIYNSSEETFFNHKLVQLANRGTFFDIGANHGMYLNVMSEKADQIYAFEPHPDNLKILEKFSSEKIKIIPAVASERDGTEKLYVCRNPLGHGQHTLSSAVASNPQWGHSLDYYIDVPSYRLDSFVQIYNIADVTAIKIDVEGAEYKVLEGAKEILKIHKPLISLETHTPGYIENIENILKECNYVFWSINGTMVSNMKEDAPYFCVPKNKLISPFV